MQHELKTHFERASLASPDHGGNELMKQEDLNQPANERLTSPRRWLGQAAGIHGLSPGQQLAILTALAARQVVLLVGPHGTAKSLLPMKLADALGLEGRYFPAHMVQLEDLIGWVAPDVGNGKLVYFRGEASIFNTEYALFDELFRAPVRLQAKLLEILLEKRIMGEKTPLQHVWLAANPAAAEYHANPIDLALLARVGLMLEMPSARDLDPDELSQVISSGNKCARAGDSRKWLPGVLERASSPELLEAVKQEDGEDLARYVENLMWTVLARYPDDADRMDGRTLNMVHRLLVHSRSVLEVCGERSPLEQDSENIGLVVEQAFPTLRLRESQIYPFPLREMHEEAWQVTFGHGSQALRASTFLAVQTQSLENLVDRVLADDLFLDDSSAEDLVSKLETVLRDAGASPEEHAAAVASLTRLLVAQPGRTWPSPLAGGVKRLEERFLCFSIVCAELAEILGFPLQALNEDRALLLALSLKVSQVIPPPVRTFIWRTPDQYVKAMADISSDRFTHRSSIQRLTSALKKKLACPNQQMRHLTGVAK